MTDGLVYFCDKLVLSFPKHEVGELAAKRLPGLILSPDGLGAVVSRQGYWIANVDHPADPADLLELLHVLPPLWGRALGASLTLRINRLDIATEFHGAVDDVISGLLPCSCYVQGDGRISYARQGSSATNFALACYDKGLQLRGARDEVGRLECRANRGGIDDVFRRHDLEPVCPSRSDRCHLRFAAAWRSLLGQMQAQLDARTRRVSPRLVPGFALGERAPSLEHERRRRVASLKRAIFHATSLDTQLHLLGELRALERQDSSLSCLLDEVQGELNRRETGHL